MLTERERSVLVLYAQGWTVKQISQELHISVKTAETHRNNIARKMGHMNRSQLTAFCIDNKLIKSRQVFQPEEQVQIQTDGRSCACRTLP